MEKTKLTKREKMIIYNCLKNMSENVTNYYIKLFDFKTGKFFNVKPDTIFKIAEEILN